LCIDLGSDYGLPPTLVLIHIKLYSGLKK
jgi:hypothetical protein